MCVAATTGVTWNGGDYIISPVHECQCNVTATENNGLMFATLE